MEKASERDEEILRPLRSTVDHLSLFWPCPVAGAVVTLKLAHEVAEKNAGRPIEAPTFGSYAIAAVLALVAGWCFSTWHYDYRRKLNFLKAIKRAVILNGAGTVASSIAFVAWVAYVTELDVVASPKWSFWSVALGFTFLPAWMLSAS